MHGKGWNMHRSIIRVVIALGISVGLWANAETCREKIPVLSQAGKLIKFEDYKTKYMQDAKNICIASYGDHAPCVRGIVKTPNGDMVFCEGRLAPQPETRQSRQ